MTAWIRPRGSMEKLLKIRSLALTVLCGLACVGAFAHGNKVHVMGKVEKINADSVQVKTRDGKSVEVKLTASTVYLLHVTGKTAQPSSANADKPAKMSDLAAGDFVVIHATSKGDALEADEVKFTVPGANSSKSAAPKS